MQYKTINNYRKIGKTRRISVANFNPMRAFLQVGGGPICLIRRNR